ncbi:MAG TPA: hypothetical protein VMX17_07100 [Candidatus Glassbacteria bacterium]|nr:hypothetical protein [Candidatus Glassbacteria bacterium]
MKDLIRRLFKEQTEAAEILLVDKDTCSQIELEIAKAILNEDGIIVEEPFSQLRIIISSMSSFAFSKDECNDVTDIIIWGLKNEDDKNVFPMITEHQGYELAKRCLISLSFFEKHMVYKWEKHAAPSPDFYRKIGISSFKTSGHSDIGYHFDNWSLFIKEFFV